MKKLFILSLFTSFMFLLNLDALAEYNPGEVWANWPEEYRNNWVLGFTSGQELLLEELKNQSETQLKYHIQVKYSHAISQIMTQCYQDPSNTYIPLKYMTHIAKMKLEESADKTIQEELELLRLQGEELLRLHEETELLRQKYERKRIWSGPE